MSTTNKTNKTPSAGGSKTAHKPHCISGNKGPEWTGSPNPANPDNEWICDECGAIIPAVYRPGRLRSAKIRAGVKLASLFAALVGLVGCETGGYYSAAPAAVGPCGGYYPAAASGYTVMSPAGMTVVSPDGLGGYMVMGPQGSAMILPNY